MTVCATCGLPKELCVCESIAKETTKVIVMLEKKKFNKIYTVVTGINEKEIDMDHVMKTLKSKLACGGTNKDNKIELQGDHKNKVKEILLTLGFAPETIEVK